MGAPPLPVAIGVVGTVFLTNAAHESLPRFHGMLLSRFDLWTGHLDRTVLGVAARYCGVQDLQPWGGTNISGSGIVERGASEFSNQPKCWIQGVLQESCLNFRRGMSAARTYDEMKDENVNSVDVLGRKVNEQGPRGKHRLAGSLNAAWRREKGEAVVGKSETVAWISEAGMELAGV